MAHPSGPDEPAARTLATGLANRTFPFIRYDLGDQVNWLAGPCVCGGAFARVADIGGRRDDDFRYETCTIPASVFRHVLGTDARVSEYQVQQLAVRGADVLVVGDPRRGCADIFGGRRAAAGTGCPIPRSPSASLTDFTATTRPGSCDASSRCASRRGVNRGQNPYTA